MTIPSPVLTKLVLILLALTIPLSAVLRAQVPCETPPGQGQESTWRKNSTVNVMIDPTSVRSSNRPSKINGIAGGTPEEQTLLLISSSLLRPDRELLRAGTPIISVMRQTPTHLGSTAQGETSGFSYNGYRGDSFMEINPGVTDPTAFAQVMSHEIGHTFRYRAKVKDTHDAQLGRWAWDVILLESSR